MSDDVAQWLEGLGLGQYAEAFAQNFIDADVLPQLTNDDLKDLGVAAVGHRRKLLTAIQALTDQNDVPQPTETAVPETDPARRSDGERRQLTVMFCDLVGSTELSYQLDPEDLREVMRHYQDAVAGCIARYDGYLAKFLGDGVLAYFGWPQAYEDQAERAVRAGLDAVGAVPEITLDKGPALRARVGIATGEVVIGDIVGETSADAEAVIGETPNLAARLQALAEPDQVLIGATTRHLVGDLFDYEDLGTASLKGIDEAVPHWRVLAERAFESRFEARHRADAVSLVGREHEVALLMDRWQRARSGEGQVVLLAGEPGIGKSHIVQILRQRVGEAPHIRLRYQCSPYHINSALYPMIQQLERAAGFRPDDPNELKLDKLEAVLTQATDEGVGSATLFASLLSLPYEARYGPLDLTPQQQKDRTFSAFLNELESLARGQPVLFVFEDAHWSDPTSRELLELTIEQIRELPVLAVITHRPEFTSPWQGYGHLTSLMLNRLGREECGAVIRTLSDGMELPEAVVEQILQKTDGVPLYVEEITKAVLDSGLLQEQGDRYVLDGPLPSLAVPATLQDSLMARLDRLSPVKEVAQIAAVIGRDFSYGLLAAVSDRGEDELTQALDALADAELIFRRGTPPDASYLFKHALVQDAAYDSLLISRRQALHARIGERLEGDFPELAAAEPEVLARHYTEAGMAESAVRYWGRAGQQAARRSANPEAVAHFSTALAMLGQLTAGPERDGQELALQLELGPHLMVTKGIVAKEVEAAYARAHELSLSVGDIGQRFVALWGLWHLNEFRAEWKQALTLADELSALAAESDDVELRLQAHHAQWSTLLFLGDLVGARDHSTIGLRLYDQKQHGHHANIFGGHDPGVCARQVAATAQAFLGHPEEALASAAEGIRLAEDLGQPGSQATMNFFAGLANQILGRNAAAAAHADASIAIAEANGILPFAQMSRILRAWAETEHGDPDAGLAELESLLEPVRSKRRKRALLPVYLGLLADAYRRLGRHEDGLSAISDALDRVADQDEHLWEAELYRLEASLLAASSNDSTPAEKSLSRAIAVARQQKGRVFELRAATDLARLWQRQGKTAVARELLAPICDGFGDGFELADLADARALLDEPD